MINHRRLQLTTIIKKNPGLNFRDLMRATGMKNGVLGHHLNNLEKLGVIFVVRSPRQSRFYPPSFSEQESKIIKALRRQTPKLIIQSLVLDDSLAFGEIVNHTKKSSSTVSLYLSQLVDDKIVQTRLSGRIKKYYLQNRDLVVSLIGNYQPSLLDAPVSGFEDIINSL